MRRTRVVVVVGERDFRDGVVVIIVIVLYVGGCWLVVVYVVSLERERACRVVWNDVVTLIVCHMSPVVKSFGFMFHKYFILYIYKMVLKGERFIFQFIKNIDLEC